MMKNLLVILFVVSLHSLIHTYHKKKWHSLNKFKPTAALAEMWERLHKNKKKD